LKTRVFKIEIDAGRIRSMKKGAEERNHMISPLSRKHPG
jgi:hypothetical protein